ncbi:hypothetical protein SAV14893_028330 [Streptomyces avermitilis]|uniref:Uncharacterized protein n=1 Tax=Streptomyces avermitilis TaxID=33903 RepID=A0A4D4LVA3_STRAX|nr:hypothetical protein SAV14893_028330 [Streptomyces avermitilis]
MRALRRGASAREIGAPEPQLLDNNDALALISSNALTLGQSALALHELRGLIGATQVVAALSLLAVDGSHEAYAAPCTPPARTAAPPKSPGSCGS